MELEEACDVDANEGDAGVENKAEKEWKGASGVRESGERSINLKKMCDLKLRPPLQE